MGLLYVFLSLNPFSFGQTPGIHDRNLPSVYLAYDSKTRVATKNDSKKLEYVVLQIHNNTTVNINVAANFDARLASDIEDGYFELSGGHRGVFLKSGSEVELCFDAEGLFVQKGYSIPRKIENPKITDLRNSCSFRSNGKDRASPFESGYWIKPNEFVKFRVPARLLGQNLKVYTEFSYPWEFKNGMLKRNEPRHKVYFYYFDLPNYIP